MDVLVLDLARFDPSLMYNKTQHTKGKHVTQKNTCHCVPYKCLKMCHFLGGDNASYGHCFLR